MTDLQLVAIAIVALGFAVSPDTRDARTLARLGLVIVGCTIVIVALLR